MTATLEIRPLAPGDWTIYRDLRLRALRDAPDAFCSTLASEGARSDQEWQARLAATASGQALPLAGMMAGQACALLWARQEAGETPTVGLYQMWVAPECRGRGVAAALLGQAIEWARQRGARSVVLGVLGSDTPAERLYRRLGFAADGPPVPVRAGSALYDQPMRLQL